MKTGFDHEQYTRLQSEHIQERIQTFGGKLYLELGGKLFDDFHASRVLPGFRPDSKVQMLLQLKDQEEILIVLNADDIEKSKVRGDLGITYDLDTLRLIDAFRGIGLYVGSVVLTRFANQPAAVAFEQRLNAQGIPTYRHYPIAGYPTDIEHIVSDEGFGKNDYVETTRPLVLVTAPGPGSGKMATCLSQLYHEHKRGVAAGYAKFETFPIWNLPLRHPVNLAYEAATADLNDVNMIDPYHLEAYGETAVNYNRDIEIFPVVRAMLEQILGKCPYNSPTDMGVNMVGKCITDDKACRDASRQEVIRRYFHTACSIRQGLSKSAELYKIEMLLSQLNVGTNDREVVEPALAKAQETGEPAVAMSLPNGKIVTGRTGNFLGACAACLLNALKSLAGIEDAVNLISPEVIEPIQHLKVAHMGNRNPRLHSDEVLIALSICAVSDPQAHRAMEQLSKLAGSEAHATVILSRVDESLFRKLGVNVTCEPQYETSKLYHR